MHNLLSRLNGWQRLWFVFAIALFIAITVIVVLIPQPELAVEDMSIIEQLNKDETYSVKVPNIGIVAFPNSMKEQAIDELITRYYITNVDTIPKIAAVLIDQRNQMMVAKAKVDNGELKASYYHEIGIHYLVWLITVTVAYSFGFSIGWIYRGFKKT